MEESRKECLDTIFGARKTYEIPSIQRGYRWDISHCDDLITDILDSFNQIFSNLVSSSLAIVPLRNMMILSLVLVLSSVPNEVFHK